MTAGEAMEVMPMSPRQSPAGLGNAVIAWVRSRRGRMLLLSAGLVLFFLAMAGARNSESISSSYQSLSSTYHLPSWRPHLPNLPAIVSSPMTPSNTTLELESGEIEHLPSQLKKTSPNFHLLMPARKDDPNFCKTTLSAMIMNYPPATTINLFQEHKSPADEEKAVLKQTLEYLKSDKLVKDEDLLLIVDGHDTWFQLPSDVVIRQYQNVLADANRRLLKRYGVGKDGMQKYNQTIVFGAEKICEGGDMACKYTPSSILPSDIYGKNTRKETALTPAEYLDSKMIMGPAKDLRTFYEKALEHFDGRHSSAGTVQSVFAAMFGEQQLARGNSARKTPKPSESTSTWLNWFGGPLTATESKREDKPETPTLEGDGQYEFSIGLDYAHMLFQPLIYAANDELVSLPHDNSTDLTAYHRAETPTPLLQIPSALEQAKPPFWTPDLSAHDPRPQNVKPPYIEQLQHQQSLDDLKPRDTPWSSLSLLQNTYTGSIPAIIHRSPSSNTKRATRDITDARRDAPSAKLEWKDLWYAPYTRALLRKYLRMTQSPIGFHNAVVGGDEMWDQRGGRGGVWTVTNALWFPWGEVDGVCGRLDQLKQIFNDGKGVWLHEQEEDAEKHRKEAEDDLKKKMKEAAEKDEKRKKEKEEKARKDKEEKEKKEKEEQEKQKQQQQQEQQEQQGGEKMRRRNWSA